MINALAAAAETILEAVDGPMTAGAGPVAASGPGGPRVATQDGAMIAAGGTPPAAGNPMASGPTGPRDGRMTAGARRATSGGTMGHAAMIATTRRRRCSRPM